MLVHETLMLSKQLKISLIKSSFLWEARALLPPTSHRLLIFSHTRLSDDCFIAAWIKRKRLFENLNLTFTKQNERYESHHNQTLIHFTFYNFEGLSLNYVFPASAVSSLLFCCFVKISSSSNAGDVLGPRLLVIILLVIE